MPNNPNKNIKYEESKLSGIVLAGGCCWRTQAYIRRIPGVALTVCGYANGSTENPDYEAVCSGITGHAEAVLVNYDVKVLPLRSLLTEYFKTIDPTSRNRQGGDSGTQYRTGIYYSSPGDKIIIHEAIVEEQKKYEKPIVTEVLPLKCFYRAEDYHQDYLEKNQNGYCHVDSQFCQAWLGASQSSNINNTKDASPINHVTSKAPPFYIQHGMADDGVDYLDSVHLYNKLAEQTGEENTKLELFPGIVHAVKIFLSEQNVDQITEWFDTVLVNEKPDLTALNNAATTARTLDMKKYATIGQQEFLAAFTQAKLILDKDYPLKDEVEDAYSALITSTGNLRLFGDVSGEGQITVTDIVKLRGLISGESKATPEQFAAGDINSDGALTVTDIVAIRGIIAG